MLKVIIIPAVNISIIAIIISLIYLYRNIYASIAPKGSAKHDKKVEENAFLNDFVPKAFEKIAKQYLIRKNMEGLIKPFIEDIGTYWYDNPKEKKNGQFDLVTKSKEGYIVYEVKFTNSKIDNKIVKEEISQIAETNLNTINFGFVSKSGFDISNDNNYILISLDDIYY